jgi:hypothetical protein
MSSLFPGAQMKWEVKGLEEIGVRRAATRNENENSVFESAVPVSFGG